jgi:perosamine synthetase
VSRALVAVRNALLGRHLREMHFYFGTVRPGDVVRALAMQFVVPRAVAVRRFEARFGRTVGAADAVSFGASRMALYAILEALGVGDGDEVIVPAFTCIVVPNAVRYRGATPVFVDIDRASWNIDPFAVERAITTRTRAVLVQHTFGVPADMVAVARVTEQRGIAIIEDCAHLIGVGTSDRQLGTLGAAAFFSFESTKPLTLGRGGMAVARDVGLRERIREIQQRSPSSLSLDGVKAGVRLLVLALLHRPSVFRFGKFVAAVLFRAHVFHPNITAAERRGERPPHYPAPLTGFQAVLGVIQMGRVAAVNGRRIELASRYSATFRDLGLVEQAHPAGLPLLRSSFLLSAPGVAVAHFAREQIELGRWFDSPVVPVRFDDPEFPSTGYRLGSCPVAEEIARHCVNLPTDPVITAGDADRAMDVLRAFVAGRSRS